MRGSSVRKSSMMRGFAVVLCKLSRTRLRLRMCVSCSTFLDLSRGPPREPTACALTIEVMLQPDNLRFDVVGLEGMTARSALYRERIAVRHAVEASMLPERLPADNTPVQIADSTWILNVHIHRTRQR